MHLYRLFHTSLTDLLAFFTYYKADADLLFAQIKVLKCCFQHSPVGVAATETPQQSAAQQSSPGFLKTLQREPWCCTCLC